MSKVLSILGCGWLGKTVAVYFSDRNYKIKASVTSDLSKLKNLPVDPYLISLPQIPAESLSFFDSDYLLIAYPPKGENNYAEKMKGLRSFDSTKIKGIVFISSTSVYEDGDYVHSSVSYQLSDSARAKSIISAENELKQLFGNKLTILRCGGLYGETRHPGKSLSGKLVSNGNAPVNMISDEDICRVIEKIIELNRWGKTYPVTHQQHPSKHLYYNHFSKIENLSPPLFSDFKSGKTVDASFTWDDLNLLPQKDLM
jgi:nucleoside-diphosphate-sugar epimerase